MLNLFRSRVAKILLDKTDEAAASWVDQFLKDREIYDLSSLLSENRKSIEATSKEYRILKGSALKNAWEKATPDAENNWFAVENWGYYRWYVVPVSAFKSFLAPYVYDEFFRSPELRQLSEGNSVRQLASIAFTRESLNSDFLSFLKGRYGNTVADGLVFEAVVDRDLYEFDGPNMVRVDMMFFKEGTWQADLNLKGDERPRDRNFSKNLYIKWMRRNEDWPDAIRFDGGYESAHNASKAGLK